MKLGTQVRLVQPVIQGSVADVQWNKEVESLEALVNYTGADGQPHSRWFLVTQLEEVQNATA